LWILAERLLIPRLQNVVIDLIHGWRIKYSITEARSFHYVWENTAIDSPLRRLFVSHCARYLDKPCFKTSLARFPNDMLADICIQLTENSTFKVPQNMADYHVKEDYMLLADYCVL
jgi:hypothetical protein